MFNITGGEVVIILILALVVLGPEKLPEAMRKFGQFYGEFKKMSSGFQSEMRNALDEPLRELRSTADLAKGIFDQPAEELKKTTDALRGAINSTLSGSSFPSIAATAPTDTVPNAATTGQSTAAVGPAPFAPAVDPAAADPAPADSPPAMSAAEASLAAALASEHAIAAAAAASADSADAAASIDASPATSVPGAATDTGIDIGDKYSLDVDELPADEPLPFDPGPGPNFYSAAPPHLAEQYIIANAGQTPTDAEATSE